MKEVLATLRGQVGLVAMVLAMALATVVVPGMGVVVEEATVEEVVLEVAMEV